ncbi:hypothetical protein [Lactobacillus delbrueckii]|jgi:maltose O-acetyltransferase|uniref:Nodulation protein L n=1 Tax=Lactobacillus delbrueckii TaxID=1584 RepID=A0ABD4W144_9LACO|nr:hypothetical protein [Lactobacillus delbrueckii]MBN6090134.1 nodulation protein L [Lactobacillus delbrueckii subsp. bulgaricus]MDA3776869.1 nodulation protein L [Lactobacillus delbrueckii]MDA3781576.1 nodulation protein L [Lactobacillus delbrueckii]MDA3795088.1 nodulation protein L [Lactobacillus delbrueckii]MDA3842291.1 nodulation protein L [Lactobacillus delbrueckii]
MDELEKMSSGDFYRLTAPEVEHYQEAGIIWNDEFRQGNNLDRPAQLLRLNMHLSALGDQASFGTSFSCLNGPNIYIGHHFLAAGGLTIEDAGEVHIGDNVVVEAGAVVAQDLHANGVFAGIPAGKSLIWPMIADKCQLVV